MATPVTIESIFEQVPFSPEYIGLAERPKFKAVVFNANVGGTVRDPSPGSTVLPFWRRVEDRVIG